MAAAAVGVGTTLGPYRLVTPIGDGGMAHVYLGLRGTPDGGEREAAIKVIRGEHTRDPKFVEMFLDEARIASFVRHPNVVSIDEVGESGGTYYMAMEFLHGVTLSRFIDLLFLRGRQLSPAAAVAIVLRVAAGLDSAHETKDESGRPLGLVHRDVSPANVLFGCGGAVKLIDFGIAKAEGRITRTLTGQAKGKLRYMAPEQMKRGDVDRRADIWAAGIVLWETLASRRLYGDMGDLEVVRAATGSALEPPGRFATVPFAIDEIAMRCLSVDPDARPSSAAELASLLAAALPEAAQIQDAQLNSLLWAVAGEELDARAAVLPIPLPTRATLVHLEPPPPMALAHFSVERGSAGVLEEEGATLMMSAEEFLETTTAPGGSPDGSAPPSGWSPNAARAVDEGFGFRDSTTAPGHQGLDGGFAPTFPPGMEAPALPPSLGQAGQRMERAPESGFAPPPAAAPTNRAALLLKIALVVLLVLIAITIGWIAGR